MRPVPAWPPTDREAGTGRDRPVPAFAAEVSYQVKCSNTWLKYQSG
jgi:hypothetical protein